MVCPVADSSLLVLSGLKFFGIHPVWEEVPVAEGRQVSAIPTVEHKDALSEVAGAPQAAGSCGTGL